MKDLLEPLLYPHNLLLYGLLFACMGYRKKGLWLLFIFYYLVGNTFVANQVRQWYTNTSAPTVAELPSAGLQYVVLGCGGSAQQLPACASARLQHLANELTQQGNQASGVLITTRYCQPYVNYLQQRVNQVVIHCFAAGDNTYQEFASLSSRLTTAQPLRFITSDFHRWRVQRLINEYQFNATVSAVSSQTFRPVNCSLNCFFTINLSNLDLYSKLVAEFSSYAVYRLVGEPLTGTAPE